MNQAVCLDALEQQPELHSLIRAIGRCHFGSRISTDDALVAISASDGILALFLAVTQGRLFARARRQICSCLELRLLLHDRKMWLQAGLPEGKHDARAHLH